MIIVNDHFSTTVFQWSFFHETLSFKSNIIFIFLSFQNELLREICCCSSSCCDYFKNAGETIIKQAEALGKILPKSKKQTWYIQSPHSRTATSRHKWIQKFFKNGPGSIWLIVELYRGGHYEINNSLTRTYPYQNETCSSSLLFTYWNELLTITAYIHRTTIGILSRGFAMHFT